MSKLVLKRKRGKGLISFENRTFSCGRCPTIYDFDYLFIDLTNRSTVKTVGNSLKREGWRYTEEYGWVCCECMHRLKDRQWYKKNNGN